MIAYFIIFFLILLCSYFMANKAESFQSNQISLAEFNQLYDSSMIPLPMNLFALGINDTVHNTYGSINENGKVLIKYWIKDIHPFLEKKQYYILICPFDGYMEYTKFKEGEMTEVIPSDYRESQFIEEVIGEDKYPIFHDKKTIFAMCKKINDKHTVLLPDIYYITRKGYKETLDDIDKSRVFYQNKKSICVWRGNLENGTNHNFFNTEGKHELNQRKYFKKLYDEKRFPKVDFEDAKMSMKEQMNFKYILDIDGFSNTWDATVWKLYSGSVLFKLRSKWKQWYYDELREWDHYIPIENDFSDLNDKIEWCIHNEDKCIKITENAKQFVLTKLNWERVHQDIMASLNGKI